MNLQEYQEKALRTESIIDAVVADKNELLHTLAMFNTIGEMLDCLKKKIYYRNPKKYNEQFEKLSTDLKFFTSCEERHHKELHEETLDVDPRVFHGVIGIATEAAELVAALQKNISGHELDPVNVQEEMADISWYKAILNDALKLSWEEGLDRNIAKLKARYPEKYSDEHAEVRNLDIERKILEGNI
jgi:NTP pyrophosphatase (non-canonical NTP hydrolase)